MTLRGIGRFTNNLASDPGVAVYSDGFYTASTVEAGKTPIFVERTEVLRGPQGTLYGRNSIGGAINVVSKRPTDKFGAEFRTSFGSYDRQAFEYLLSGPITDNARYLLGGNMVQQEKG
jgi:iron complex outermembrane receptor protein